MMRTILAFAARSERRSAWRAEIEKKEPLAVQLAAIRVWQKIVGEILVVFFAPLTLAITIGALTLLWLLLTNRAELVIH